MRRAAIVAVAIMATACNALLAIDDLPTPIDGGTAALDAGDDATLGSQDGASPGAGPEANALPDAGPETSDASIDAPEDGACVPSGNGACGLLPQCGCGAGQTCDLADPPRNVACVDAGTLADGQLCPLGAGCAPGLTCYLGTCHAFCNGPGAFCATSKPAICGTDVAGQVFVYSICHYVCDLVDGSACPAGGPGVECSYDFLAAATDCTAAVDPQTSCGGGATCAAGYVCLSGAGSESGVDYCGKWCHSGAGSSECQPGKNCVVGGTYPATVVNGVTYGLCQ